MNKSKSAVAGLALTASLGTVPVALASDISFTKPLASTTWRAPNHPHLVRATFTTRRKADTCSVHLGQRDTGATMTGKHSGYADVRFTWPRRAQQWAKGTKGRVTCSD